MRDHETNDQRRRQLENEHQRTGPGDDQRGFQGHRDDAQGNEAARRDQRWATTGRDTEDAWSDQDRGWSGRDQQVDRGYQGRGQGDYGPQHGNRDFGNRDFGNRDFGNRDFGNRDFSNRDFGGRDYQTGRAGSRGYQGDVDYGRGQGYQGGQRSFGGQDYQGGQGQYRGGQDYQGTGHFGGQGYRDEHGSWDMRPGGMGSRSQGQSQGQSFKGRAPRGYKRSDERIHEDICDRLMQQAHIDAGDVEVKVVNGEVTLTGTVESRAMKHNLENFVDAISGVQEIHNQLRVKREGDTASTGAQSMSTAKSGQDTHKMQNESKEARNHRNAS